MEEREDGGQQQIFSSLLYIHSNLVISPKKAALVS